MMIAPRSTLGYGFKMLRVEALNARFGGDLTFQEKLISDLQIECHKFFLYRSHKIRSRQWLSIQRIRALMIMIAEVQSFTQTISEPFGIEVLEV